MPGTRIEPASVPPLNRFDVSAPFRSLCSPPCHPMNHVRHSLHGSVNRSCASCLRRIFGSYKMMHCCAILCVPSITSPHKVLPLGCIRKDGVMILCRCVIGMVSHAPRSHLCN